MSFQNVSILVTLTTARAVVTPVVARWTKVFRVMRIQYTIAPTTLVTRRPHPGTALGCQWCRYLWVSASVVTSGGTTMIIMMVLVVVIIVVVIIIATTWSWTWIVSLPIKSQKKTWNVIKKKWIVNDPISYPYEALRDFWWLRKTNRDSQWLSWYAISALRLATRITPSKSFLII